MTAIAFNGLERGSLGETPHSFQHPAPGNELLSISCYPWEQFGSGCALPCGLGEAKVLNMAGAVNQRFVQALRQQPRERRISGQGRRHYSLKGDYDELASLSYGAVRSDERSAESFVYRPDPGWRPLRRRLLCEGHAWRKRIQVEQGVYEIARKPSLYGWARSKVRLPREWHEIPAVYKTVTVTQRTRTHYVWEKRLVNGRDVMCKVKVPGEHVTVEKQVLVSPARRVAVGAPQYAYSERRVLIRPYKNIAIYHPAKHIYTTERVSIQPEGYVWRKARRAELWD
jgi:hypothetical protein